MNLLSGRFVNKEEKDGRNLADIDTLGDLSTDAPIGS